MWFARVVIACERGADMSFTDNEKSRVLHFLAYPDWVSLSGSIQLGFPAASQPLFLVEDAFQRLTPGGEESTRKNLCECESIELQMSDARSRLRARKVGNIEMNPDELMMLKQELTFWSIRLADDLGVISDPYAQAAHAGLASIGGVSGRSVG